MGHYRGFGAWVPVTGVDQSHESVRTYLRVHAGVCHRVCKKPFGTVCTIWTWFGDDVSSWVPSLLVHLAETWSFSSPRRLARQRHGRSPCFADSLGGDFSRSPRLVGSLGGDLVIRPALQTCSTNGPERGYGSHFGYLVPRYPTAAPSLRVTP
jgi:hypothetical protein